MGHGIGARGGGTEVKPQYVEIQTQPIKAIVVEDVRVIKKDFIVDIPRINYQDETQVRYITEDKEQIKYKTIEEKTTQYLVDVKPTTQYHVIEENTIKYNIKEQETILPKLVEKEYEKPVIIEKKYELASYSDVKALKELLQLIPLLVKEVESLKQHVSTIKDIKIEEKIVPCDKVVWVTKEVERYIYKDKIV